MNKILLPAIFFISGFPEHNVKEERIESARADRAEIFAAECGAILQEYFVYFKKLQQNYAAKFPQAAAAAFDLCFLKAKTIRGGNTDERKNL